MKAKPGISMLEIRFKKPDNMNESVRMIEIVEHVYHAKVKFRGPIKEYKYQYVRMAFDSEFNSEDSEEKDKSKGKKYLRLGTFFDIIDSNIINQVTKKKPAVEHLIKFLLDNSDKPDRHFGCPAIFKELVNFMAVDGTKHVYSSFFKEVLAQINKRKDKDLSFAPFITYIVEVFGYIKRETIIKKKKYLIPIVT